MLKHYPMKRVILPILLLVACQAWAQTRVTGKVTSGDDGMGLPGVSILEKGTTNGSVTDSNGDYSISVNDNAVLVFSFVGFASQEIPVTGSTNVNVVLQPDVTALSEIVVIGYGEIEKKDATGAVVNLSQKDFNKGVMTSPQDLIVGKFAGVSVISQSGAPGANAQIRIRGGSSLTASNDPLIVIDGFPVDNSTPGGVANPLASLNPNDIETYTVLKDASAAAIYGSRAANGVIIITTKKGREGGLQLNYNGNYSISTPVKYLDVLTGDEFRALAAELNASGEFGLTDEALDLLGAENTDWQKEIFRSAFSHDHNVSASGSLKTVPYRVSYGYTDQQGILRNTDFKRHSLNVNLTPSFLNDDLKVTISAKGSVANNNFGDAGAVGNAISFDPTQPVFDGNETYGGYFSWLTHDVVNGNSNPVAMIEQTDNQSDVNRIIANAQVEYRLPFLRDLKAHLNVGIDRTVTDGYNFAPIESGFIHQTGTLIGRNNTYGAESQSKLLDFYFSYMKQNEMHRLDFTAGYGWQHFYREGWNIDSNEATTVEREYKNENFLVSFFGRMNYTFNDKYLLTATLRNDGSSRFSEENRWGLFPSVAFAWQIHEESFLDGLSALSNLKLRAGWGVTGQQDLPGTLRSPYYPYLAIYRGSDDLAQYQLGDQFYVTQRPEPYDANIQWEETTTLNLGLDFGFMNERFTGTVEVFRKETTDLLNEIGIANGVNFSNFLITNVGSMLNEGIEVTLNANAITTSNLNWNVGVNFTSISSEITKLNLTDDPSYPGVNAGNIGVDAFIQNHQVGYPASSFLVFQQVYDASGMPVEGLFVDRSGEGGTVSGNNNNKYRYKDPAANYLIGLNSRLTYENFDFSFSSRLSLGNFVHNRVESGNAYYNNVYTLQHFRNIPSMVSDTEFSSQQQYSDYFIQDASFFKMDNISLGYNLNDVIATGVRARLSLTVQNAFVITEYKGIDPEHDDGIDDNIYPRPRTFLLGLNVTF